MPIYDRGYRRFEGKSNRRFQGWWVIAKSEIALRFTRKPLLFLVIIPSFLPAVGMMIGAYILLQSVQSTRGRPPEVAMLAQTASMAQNFLQSVGASYYFLFFQIHASVFLLLWGAFVGSDLIANDRKSNALELYFTRPIRRLDYLLGKFATLFFFLLLTTLLPALLLYGFAVAIAPPGSYSGHDSYFGATSAVPGAIVVYSLIQAAVASLVVLALSSFGRSWILIGAIWGGIFLFSQVAYQIVSELSGSPKAVVLSLKHSLLTVGRRVFEIPQEDHWRAAAWMLAIVSAASLVVLLRRIRVVETIK